jgi:hypothetical protein
MAMAMTKEERDDDDDDKGERDNAVPGHGCDGWADGGNDVDPTVAMMTAWRRTGWR